MEKYISTRKSLLEKLLIPKAPKVNDDALQLGFT